MRRASAILSIAPFVALAAWLPTAVSATTATRIAPTMIGVDIAVAVFAVNFSFVAFQLAPYRQVLAGVSWRHVAGAGALLFLALVPLVGLAAGTWATGRIAVAAVPLLVASALGLVVLALAEASPRRILATCTAPRAQRRFLGTFVDAVAIQAAAISRIDSIKTLPDEEPRMGPPMHELGHRLPPPPVAPDPVEVCVAVAHAAVERDDAIAFGPAIERLIALTFELRAVAEEHVYADMETWEIREAIGVHVAAALARVQAVAGDDVKHAVLLDRYMETIARLVREAAVDGDIADKDMVSLFFAANAAACRQVERKTSGPGTIGVLIAARQACQLGVRRIDDRMDVYRLANYADAVQHLGETAIDAEDPGTLWKCLETLGWIGCAAVRAGSTELTSRAAGALVQLGRLARHAQLECHWDRCALTPYQHALERLEWLLSWVPETENSERWLYTFDKAVSRLTGQHYTFEYLAGADAERPTVTYALDEEPWIEGYSADGASRRLDYSDHTMLKQQAL